jgi:E3 ubiquitin-protein ligase MARCH6
MHLVAPYFLRYFKPRRTGRRIIRIGWQLLAKNLRLSAYMFGGKFPKEELTYPSWFSWEGGKFEGGFRRVPNRDGIAVIKDNPVVIETNRDGVALSQKGQDLIDAQNAECVKAKREIQKDFVTVYVPPHFRLRLFLFVCGVGLLGILALIVAIGVPVPLGRHVFSLFTSEEVHDGYSFIAGCSMIWTCFSIGKALNECVNRRLIDIYAPSLETKAARASWSLFLLKEGIRWAGQVTWLVCWIGFVIPVLIAIVVDLYLVFPLRHMYDRGFEMRIDLPLAWLTGILYMMIGLKVVKKQPGQRHRLMVEIDRVRLLFGQVVSLSI